MKTTVIHHSADFDGLFCREIARKFLPDAELIGWDYKDAKIPFPSEGAVYVLDLSPECFDEKTVPNPDDLSMRLIWIDHHKTAIDRWNPAIKGYRLSGVAACRLAWQWFSHYVPDMNTPEKINPFWERPDKDVFFRRGVVEPLAVRLAGEYDIWDKRDPRAELFQHGLRSRALGENLWDLMLSGPTPEQDGKQGAAEITVDALLESGECLQYAKTQENAAIIERQGYTLQWEGLTFLACNHAMFNSHLFTAGIKPEHDALLGFRFDGRNYHVSLYHAPGKEQHDLSAIAVKHGGGGHRGACGFRVEKLPFLE